MFDEKEKDEIDELSDTDKVSLISDIELEKDSVSE